MPYSRKRLGSIAYSMVMFTIVSVLAGVLVAGLFVPFAGLAGLGSRSAAEALDNLPAELATPSPPTRTQVLLADGSTLAYFYDENRVPVTLDQIAPVMRQAQLAIEDHRFYQHGALDLKGTARALVRNTSSDSGTQGGSSISQQYVKMVQVEACTSKRDMTCAKEAIAPTLQRKVRELRYAIALEKKFSKDQILDKYLNIAYYGEGAYGVEAAARHYFSTSAAALTLPQAAMLAGLVQNPDANNPVRNKSAALDRRDVVLNRMAELGLITVADARAAKKVDFDEASVRPTRNGCLGTRYPFLCDYVRLTLLKTESLGATVQERTDTMKRGGLVIQTAIDPTTQDTAQSKVSAVVGPTDPLISTMDMIQPGTGLIVAMAQSRPVMGSDTAKGETYWDLSADRSMGGNQGYQAGSTFKAFTAAAALQKGIPLSKKYDARQVMNYKNKPYQSCRAEPRHVLGKWLVHNSTGHNGVMDMYEAAAYSVNNYFVQLELATGLCDVTKMARDLGVKVGTPDRDLVGYYQKIPAFTLGSVEVSPLSMAEAYATFAARGIHCTPVVIQRITSRDGGQLAAPSADCHRVISTDVADGINKLLSHVMTDGTGKRALTDDRRPQAGKTGTISSAEAVWFAGYTPEIAGVSMISIDNQQKPFVKSKAARKAHQFRTSGVYKYVVPSTGVRLEGSGSGDAGKKIWKPTMDVYLKNVPATAFADPSKDIDSGKEVTLPDISGLSVSEATQKLQDAGFTVETQFVYSSKPVGRFVRWTQRRGKVAQFATLYVQRSNGREDPAVVQAREDKARAQEEKAQERADAKAAAKEEKAQEKAQRKADKRAADAEKQGKKDDTSNGGSKNGSGKNGGTDKSPSPSPTSEPSSEPTSSPTSDPSSKPSSTASSGSTSSPKATSSG